VTPRLEVKEPEVDLAAATDDIANQLCQAVDGDFDLCVRTASGDERVQKLAMLINFVVDSARRAIADLRREHERLQESEQRHRDYITNTPYGVFVTDEAGHFVQVNPAACRMTGYTEAELLAMSIPELLAPEECSSGMAAFQAALRVGRAQLEQAICTRSGERRWLSISTVTLSATRSIGFSNDVTERVQAELALQDSQAILSTVLNAIPVRVFWKDRELRYLGSNQACAQDAGFADPAAMVGKDDYAMAWHQDADKYRADDRAVIDSGETRLLFEECQTTASGERLHLLTSKLPLRDANGTIIGVLGTYYNITPLRQSQKLQAVGQLAAGIAHEINTPSQFVGDSVQFLADSQPGVKALITAYRNALSALPAEALPAAARASIAELEA